MTNLNFFFQKRDIRFQIFKINSKFRGKFKVWICGTFNLIDKFTHRDNSRRPIKNRRGNYTILKKYMKK